MTLTLIVQLPCYADVAANKRHEVEHLIRFVRDSGCVIDSDGAKLTGIYASAEIQQLYARNKHNIHSSEDFIAWTAAKSSVIGKYSMVACPGSELTRTIDWLQKELTVYRFKRRF